VNYLSNNGPPGIRGFVTECCDNTCIQNMSVIEQEVVISGQSRDVAEMQDFAKTQGLNWYIQLHQVIGLCIITYAEYMGIKHFEPIFFVEPDGPVVFFPNPQPHIG